MNDPLCLIVLNIRYLQSPGKLYTMITETAPSEIQDYDSVSTSNHIYGVSPLLPKLLTFLIASLWRC
jgi:hypothetical protein